MSLEQLRGRFCWLTSVVVRTDLRPSTAVVELGSEGGGATLRFEGVLHATVCVADPDGDLVDEVLVRELPRDGPWPEEARHLLEHHDNRRALQWLTLTGPGEVEILAERFSEE
ncbi:hypothetical protein ACFY00_08965 [Kitasatospora sp. NPDC001540]|uniref:hypothetical protein n=1 Tax=Kitasatospora sp. NPDC001540 TaxID=3364014 RepID=UPI0036A7A09C